MQPISPIRKIQGLAVLQCLFISWSINTSWGMAIPQPPAPLLEPTEISYAATPGYKDLEWSDGSAIQGFDAHAPASLNAPNGLRIRWLGAAGFEISDDETTVLLDPFVSRPQYVPVLLFQKIAIDPEAVEKYVLKGLDLSRVKVILNSHTHHDHFLDIPYILSQYPHAQDRPLTVGDRNLKTLLENYDKASTGDIPWLMGTDPLSHSPQSIIEFTEADKFNPPMDRPLGYYVGTFGDFKITAYINNHGLYDLYPFIKMDGEITEIPPMHSYDYRAYLNSTLNYLIEYKGKFRIFSSDATCYINSERISKEVGKVDLLLQGMAARENCDYISERIAGMQPKYMVATHFDNFFIDLRHMHNFDYKILMPNDQSKFEIFLKDFNSKYIPRAKTLAADPEFREPELRLMRMFYYYSINSLL